jgi:hypothetical protein
MSADGRAPAPIGPAPAPIGPADVERWLGELELRPVERSTRDGISSWDLVLDGRRRHGIRLTLILDPSLALVVWVHYAPPIGDSFRKSYRKLLSWNDEYPFAKFGLAEDDRPVLTSELPVRNVDRDELGLAIARLLAICDQLLDESAAWLGSAGKVPEVDGLVGANPSLLAAYAGRLAELALPELALPELALPELAVPEPVASGGKPREA